MNSRPQRTHAVDQVGDEIKVSRRPNELLIWLQKESRDLLAEDAFVVPLWFSQQSKWLEEPLDSDSTVYNYPLLLRIRGPLNEDALQQSLQEIVRRHEILRSVFRMKDREMVQVVIPPTKQRLGVTDLSGLPKTEREARSRRLALEEAHHPFDLTKGPLLRSALIRLGTDDHVLQLTTHHIVYDDWSTGILSRELSELYEAFAAGIGSPLRDLVFQYGDYVRWHQEQLQVKTSKLFYLKQQLASPTAFQHLATDFVRPASCTNRGARERMVLPADLINSLRELSRQERVSLFMVLLAGFQCLLQRYSDHEEIGIASCAANRPLTEVEGLIGRFGNDILLRTSLSGNPTFSQLLVRVRETCLNAYSDQDLPFGKLLKEVADGVDPNRKSPFQVMFILQNAPQENRQVPGLGMSWFSLDTGTAKYDLNVWLKIGLGLEVILEYRTDLFRSTTMKRILDDYQAVLETMAKDPSARLHTLLIARKAAGAQAPPVSTVAKGMQELKVGVAPKDDVQSRLVKLWEAAFRIRPIGVDQDFFELGGDSLLAARLFTQIEKTFQMDLPLAMLLEAPTIKQLAGAISGRRTRLSDSSLMVIQSLGLKPPLFCVHGHMGEIFYCRNLSRSLGPDQPLFGLRSQGLGGESPRYTVEDMAIHYLSEIRAVQPEGPYFLSGYCFGGMVAYEMARLLKTRGEDVALLAVFNTPSPGSLTGWPLTRAYLIKRIIHELRKLRTLPNREKLAVFRTKAVGLARLASGSFKAALWRGLVKSSIADAKRGSQRLLSVADINVSAAKAYRPDAYPGRITLFLTEEAKSLYATDPRDGWMALAGDGIEVHSVAGDNGSLFNARFVDALAEKLKSCIAKAHEHEWEASAKQQDPS